MLFDMLFDIFPGISPTIRRSVFDIEGLKGVILRTYGSGNAPTNEEFLKGLDYAINTKGLAVVNITQCNQGMVEMGLYEVTSAAIRFGGDAFRTPKEGEPSPELVVFMNYPHVTKDTSTEIPQCLGTVKSDTDFVLRCTDKVRQIANPGLPMRLTVLSKYGDISWDSVVFSIYTDVD